MMLVLAMLAVASIATAETAVPADAATEARSLTVKTFTLKHRSAERAVAIIKPLLSAEGSVSLQANSLIINDTPANVKKISAAVAEYDRPAQAFKLTVRLVAASRAAQPNVPEELKEIGAKLAVLQFNAFEALGSANVDAKEGDTGLIDLQTGYRADFKLGEYDPASDTVKVEDFRVSRQQNDQLTQLVKTTLNLKVGQMFILGATKSSTSARALMVVVTARR
jgi:hypothetical protein